MNSQITVSNSITFVKAKERSGIKHLTVTFFLLGIFFMIILFSAFFKTEVILTKYSVSHLNRELVTVKSENKKLEYIYSEETSIPALKEWAEEHGFRPVKEGEYFLVRDESK